MRRPVRHPGTAGFGLVLALAARVLARDRYLTWPFPDAQGSHVPGAYDGTGAPVSCARGPVTSTGTCALKIAAGYVLRPGHENDSCYFLLRL
jgi:hypothetical protein